MWLPSKQNNNTAGASVTAGTRFNLIKVFAVFAI
jgi:hypothetical protein